MEDQQQYMNMIASQSKEQVLSAIKELVNADQIVKDIRFQLTGKKQIKVNNNGKVEIQEVKYHEPLLNDVGCSKVLADFRSYINSNIVLTYLKEDDIQARSKVYFTNVVFELARNMVKYEINTKENTAKIRTILTTNFHSALWRAYNGMTLLTSLKNISVNEIRDLGQDQRSDGMRGIFRK